MDQTKSNYKKLEARHIKGTRATKVKKSDSERATCKLEKIGQISQRQANQLLLILKKM